MRSNTVVSQGRVQEFKELCSIFVPLFVFFRLLYFHLYFLPRNHAVFAFFSVLQVLGDLNRSRVILSFYFFVLLAFVSLLFLTFFFMLLLLLPFLGLLFGFTAGVATA